MCNFWLVPMDFRICNFRELQSEWIESHVIRWQVPGTPMKYRNGAWKKPTPSSMAAKLKLGDVLYFYVCNLPSDDGEKLSRVLLRGVVKDEPRPMEKLEIYRDSTETELVYGFSITALTTIPRDALADNNFLSLNDLRQRSDGTFRHAYGKNWPDLLCKKTFDIGLIEQLEAFFKPTMEKNDFEQLIEHFNRRCFLEGKYGTKNDHRSFIARNGMRYCEYHHLVPKSVANKFHDFAPIVHAPGNGLYLCANCHRKIHFGEPEAVRDMLKIFLSESQVQEMLHEYDFQKLIGEKQEVLAWFQNVYGVGD